MYVYSHKEMDGRIFFLLILQFRPEPHDGAKQQLAIENGKSFINPTMDKLLLVQKKIYRKILKKKKTEKNKIKNEPVHTNNPPKDK